MNENKPYTLHLGDCLDVLKTLPDNSVDSIVTDPPYELGFMGKKWDSTGIANNVDMWSECFRVLKHGGHLLSFSGSRTYHRMTCAIEDAGFEIRDQIMWVYGCLSEDSEVLTKYGWEQYHTATNKDILIYDTTNDIYKWETPERWSTYCVESDTAYRITSDTTDQIVSRGHRCLVKREGKLTFVQADELSGMEYMPTLSDDFSFIQETESSVLRQSVQRSLSGVGMETTCAQSTICMDRRKSRQSQGKDDGIEQSSVERRSNPLQTQGKICGSENQICSMSDRILDNGEKRWLCNGTSPNNGANDQSTIDENGMCASYQSRCNRQSDSEFDVICDKCGSQEIRARTSYNTTMATITPIEYTGMIFCPTVSTGAFVARRNGKVFVTGNSGFPKSLNISKAIDKAAGAEREVIGASNRHSGKSVSTDTIDDFSRYSTAGDFITAPATDAAKRWDGWGTALKPAHEPICVARKPLSEKTIADNVLKHGTGGLNIDGCRVPIDIDADASQLRSMNRNMRNSSDGWGMSSVSSDQPTVVRSDGRFPANLIHDGSDEVLALFPDTKSGALTAKQQINGGFSGTVNAYGTAKTGGTNEYESSEGNASRFFYCAKTSKTDRHEGLEAPESQFKHGDTLRKIENIKTTGNNHPTVKPTELMRYLVRLVTPPNGTVLDPFMGSGSTGKASMLEGFKFIGIDMTPEYMKIAEARIKFAHETKEKPAPKSKKQKPVVQSTDQLGF